MVEPFRTDPVIGLGHVNEYVRETDPHRYGHRHGQPGAFPYPPSQPPPLEHSVADVASILGLPEAVVTAPVLAAVTGLLSEVDRLRWHEDHAHRRLELLEAAVEHHAVVPDLLNRRGFLRRLDGVLATGGVGGTLAILHVGGVEALVERSGLAAGDGALRHVAAHLGGSLRASDVVGLVGPSDFALLLGGTDLAAARPKMRGLMAEINAHPFVWDGASHPFALFAGYHVLWDGDSGESALAAADRARRGFS
jgi:GGDEF domain-containing protein